MPVKLPVALLLVAILVGAVPPAHAEALAITFDDLPLNGTLAPGVTRARLVRDVLPILKAAAVPPVVGFVNSVRLEGSADGAEALQLWVGGGQRVANHTYSHSDIAGQTAEAFIEDVRRNEPVLELLDPGHDWHWLRYPYLHEGDTQAKRRAVRSQLAARGYRIAQVTLDYEDYLWNSPYARCSARHDERAMAWLRSSYLSMAAQYLDADRAMAKLVYGREISHVLLLHLGAYSSTILPDLLALLRERGFTLVTLEEAQRDPAYATDPDAGSAHGGTLLEQWLDVRKLKYPPVPRKPYKELEALCN
jgi:peptidoglycan-N-acetylglucosamine deacetylase